MVHAGTMQGIATDVAARFARDVDRLGRYPRETMDALKDASLLSVAIPTAMGGGGATLAEVLSLTRVLASGCASSAMIFAMHQIEVACLLRHAGGQREILDFLHHLPAQQYLIASATSEAGTGGDMGRSIAPLCVAQDRFQAEKMCPVVSYAREADAILMTLRRAPDASQGDQVLVLASRDEYELDVLGDWDSLGMRGTVSVPVRLSVNGSAARVIADDFRNILAATMVPFAHLAWAHVWLGIAEDAFAIARRSVLRDRTGRGQDGGPSPAAQHLASASLTLQTFQALVDGETRHFATRDTRSATDTFRDAVRYNNLKVASSKLVIETCAECMRAGGIRAFQNPSEFSLGRHVRDAMSAELMIANDRLLLANSDLLLLAG